MSKIADKDPIDFVLNAGDNIYFMGVNHPGDNRFYVRLSRFLLRCSLQSSFEYPYSYDSLKDRNWYMIGGNHDHFGTIEAQVNYTKRSKMWLVLEEMTELNNFRTYPDVYYKISYVLKDGTTVGIVVIDTIKLCGNTKDIDV